MSSERTQPPSIAPKKPASPRPTALDEARAADLPKDATPIRPVSAPVTGATAPSVGERIRRTAASVADAARTVLPSREASNGSPPPSPGTTGTTATTATTATSATTATGRAATTATSPAAAPAAARVPRTGERPAAAAPSSGPRRVRLAVARIDPWSVMKLSFLLSVAIGIMLVVATAVVWYTLDGLAVFTSVNTTIAEITGDPTFFDLLEYAAFPRVVSLATMIAVVDVVLLTALATIGAFLYNIVAALVGGVTVTLTDD